MYRLIDPEMDRNRIQKRQSNANNRKAYLGRTNTLWSIWTCRKQCATISNLTNEFVARVSVYTPYRPVSYMKGIIPKGLKAQLQTDSRKHQYQHFFPPISRPGQTPLRDDHSWWCR